MVSTTHNPTTEALCRDGPEPRRCSKEFSVGSELLFSPKKERIVQPNKNHSIDVLRFGDSLVRVPYEVVLKQQSSVCISGVLGEKGLSGLAVLLGFAGNKCPKSFFVLNQNSSKCRGRSLFQSNGNGGDLFAGYFADQGQWDCTRRHC